MKRSRWIWIGGVVIFMTSVIDHIPAELVLRPFTLSFHGVRLSGITGSLWRGHAGNVQVRIKGRHVDLGELNWNVSLTGLALARLGADIQFGIHRRMDLRGSGELGMSFNGLYARDLKLFVPASVLGDWLRLPVPVAFDGQLQLSIENYQQGSSFCRIANGRMDWSRAQARWMSVSLDLGRAKGQWECREDNLSVSMEQLATTVDSEWKVLLTPKKYQLNGSFVPKADFPKGGQAQLSWLSPPDANGRYTIRDAGRW